MLINYGSQLHYRCAFELIPKNSESPSDWNDIVKIIRKWVSKRCGDQDEFGKRSFYTGLYWKDQKQSRLCVQTSRCIGHGTASVPEFWSVRYEHPCDNIPLRQWRTDIGLTSIGRNQYRFVLATTHTFLSGYIGDEPLPTPTAPGIITSLIAAKNWTAVSGGSSLRTTPIILAPQGVSEFVEKLKIKNRCPFVLISLDYKSQLYKMVPSQLSRLLAGTALVYATDSSDIDKELEFYLPPDLRCWNGMVRVYQPGVIFDCNAGTRHRFFTGNDIEKSSVETVQNQIVCG
jgi:hypothetical protein